MSKPEKPYIIEWAKPPLVLAPLKSRMPETSWICGHCGQSVSGDCLDEHIHSHGETNSLTFGEDFGGGRP